ncbi:hypothetical protein IHE45_18G000200 [Dioscorea alata]|uniref:Uncharacterized protein n=1 Tax=Dioscorea alata TaxID=55571 RepID=A0ACB7U4P7_DIOAL|nr:hypothetical protein IHE45_18G000200 [Dioscorea alata]
MMLNRLISIHLFSLPASVIAQVLLAPFWQMLMKPSATSIQKLGCCSFGGCSTCLYSQHMEEMLSDYFHFSKRSKQKNRPFIEEHRL